MSGQDGMLSAITGALNRLSFELSPLNDGYVLNNSGTCRPHLRTV